jgi:DNA-binding transcriptional LysR family regulator
MELRHLRYFQAVAQFLSYSKAAEFLHVSQPTISRQLQELADEIGTPIFERQGNKTILTLAGEYFKIEIDQIFAHLEAATRTARILGEEHSKTIKIACVNFFVEPVFLPMLDQFSRLHPGVKIEILVMSTEAQEDALRQGSIDVGFSRRGSCPGSLDFCLLYEENLILIFPAALYGGGDFRECMRRLEGHPFVTLCRSVAPGLVERLISICVENGIHPEIGLESSDAYSVISIVAAGHGWSIVPSLSRHNASIDGLGSIELPYAVDIGLLCRSGKKTKECMQFIELAKRHFAGETRRREGA